MPHHDIDSPVAIVGAGPYGLAAAAHLHSAGVRARVFGEPMEFWERHMPRGMFLRSSEACSQIADPRRRLTIGRWRAEHGVPRTAPVPLADFVAYGRWYQQHAVGALERQRVEGIEQAEEGFRVRLQSGEQFTARRVVLATGIGPFAWRPPQFDGLPAELASHTLDPGDLSRFAGRRVAVIGGGQSALESAALLAEGGAEVEVLVRAREIRWLRARGATDEEAPLARLGRRARELLRPVTRPNLDIMGPRFVSWLVAWPNAFRAAPDALQRRLTVAAVRPAGASWLKPRLAGQRLTRGRAVTAACRTNAHVRLH